MHDLSPGLEQLLATDRPTPYLALDPAVAGERYRALAAAVPVAALSGSPCLAEDPAPLALSATP